MLPKPQGTCRLSGAPTPRPILWLFPLLFTLVLAISALSLPIPAAAIQATGTLQITTSPQLFPAFNPEVTDYVIPSGADDTVQVNVKAPRFTDFAIDGKPFRKLFFQTTVNKVLPGQSFSIVVKTVTGSRTYSIRRLPPDFPNWTTERRGVPQAEFYLFAPGIKVDFSNLRKYVVIADGGGIPVWWYRSDIFPIDAKVLPNGHLGWLTFAAYPGAAQEYGFDGKLIRSFTPPAPLGGGLDNHELLLLPNGNYLFIVNVQRGPIDLRPFGGPVNGSVIDNTIVEVSPEGKLVWSWSSLDHIDLSEVGQKWWQAYMVNPPADPFHMNSVERDGNGYIISLRHLNALIRIDRATGTRSWKLGGSQRPESLTYLQDPFSNFSGQHDARVLPDGTLSLHDNGTVQGRPPRAVRYRLNLTTRSATLVEQITDPAVPFSGCCGSARRLGGGNWVMEWGDNPAITELAPDGSLVLRLTMQDAYFSYRADAIPFGRIRRSDLRDGMDKQFPRAPGR